MAEHQPSPSPHVYYDANPTLGALLVAALLSSFLFGILTIQVNFYFTKFSKDLLWIRILVAMMWVIELGHLTAVCFSVHTWTIRNYGHPDTLVHAPNGVGVSILLSGLVAPVVQAYFADRLRVLSKSISTRIITCTLWVFAFLRCLGAFAVASLSIKIFRLDEFEHNYRWLIATFLSVGTFSDIVICTILLQHVHPKFSHNKALVASVIDQLIAWTIRNGAVLCIISITTLVSFLAVHNAFIWHSIFAVLTRLFANFFLSSLNSRSKKPNTDTTSTEPSTLYTFSDILSTPRFAPPSVKENPTMMSSTADPLSTLMSEDETYSRRG